MISAQVENWIKYSNCILNNVIHKTNRYSIALSLFIRFDNDHHNILLTQAFLVNESFESHKWMLFQIIETINIQPSVILIDANLTVDITISQVFQFTYYIYYAFHITQNLYKNLRKVLGEDYQRFLNEFYKCHNSIVKEIFQQHFDKLIIDHPNSKNYLEFLYKIKTS